MKDKEAPAAPSIPPKVRLHRSEKIGLPFVFLLPALAIIESSAPIETVEARSGPVLWSAEYPSRQRFGNSNRVLVRVQNRGPSSASDVSLTFDPAYIHAFSSVTFDPAPDSPYSTNIERLRPGESRLAAVQPTADEYGSHQGWIALSADRTETRIELSALIFPQLSSARQAPRRCFS